MMDKWLVEWKSGRTEEVRTTSPMDSSQRVLREGGWQVWPADWTDNPNFVSAVRVEVAKEATRVSNALMQQQMAGMQNAMGQNIAQQLPGGLGGYGA